MKRSVLYFEGPGRVSVREEDLPLPQAGQVLVRTILSAISAGTELMVYRGDAPAGEAVDDTIASLSGTFQFPLKYGYSTVGEIVETGIDVAPGWVGKKVFAFHPHESYFNEFPDKLILLPELISYEDAVYLPNMETAVNFVMDGQPAIGEKVAVFGQGIVGLFTTALLNKFPLANLVTFDRYNRRRDISLKLGARASLDPGNINVLEKAKSLFNSGHYRGADLVYELSGFPDALNMALSITGFNARVVVGSWYGQKRVDMDLGGRFHRDRVQLISSQVSTIMPQFAGRWNKERRFEVAMQVLQELKPSQYISHRFDISHGDEAFRLLDKSPEEVLQAVITY